jgi:membrane protease YdiL (CAAX protease family)
MKQLNAWTVLAIWAFLCFGGAFFASWQGYGGRPFTATLSCFSFLLLVMLLFAARGISDKFNAWLGQTGAICLCVCVLFIYIFYLFGVGALALERIAVVTALIFVPILLAHWAGKAPAGAWQDFASIVGIWVFVKFGPRLWLWPYPDGKLAHVFTVLIALSTAIGSFLLIRKAKGVGYSIGWGKGWGVYVVGSFVGFACIAIPLGIALHFISFSPLWSRWNSYAGLSLAILVFTAWPEEFLFRGLLQNFLAKASKSDFAGWWTASMIFGFSHLPNMGFPNWRYATLAAIAGLFYGWTWRKTGSIFASALVHAAVDSVWHFFFRTL